MTTSELHGWMDCTALGEAVIVKAGSTVSVSWTELAVVPAPPPDVPVTVTGKRTAP